MSYARVFFYADPACRRPIRRGDLFGRMWGGDQGPDALCPAEPLHHGRHWVKVMRRPSKDGRPRQDLRENDLRRLVTIADFPGHDRVFVVVCWPDHNRKFSPVTSGFRFWLVPGPGAPGPAPSSHPAPLTRI